MAPGLGRRDFVLLRIERSTRVVEWSCQQLYMRFLDARSTSAPREDLQDDIADPWGNEPPAVFKDRAFAETLNDLERDLDDVDVLRMRDSQWIANEEFGRALEGVLARFKARGGRVERLS